MILWKCGDYWIGEFVDLGEGGSVCSAVVKSSIKLVGLLMQVSNK